jgi:Calcineurin-like phosphoesterase/Purple acid Phosphatase, N-terminal domain
LSQRDNLHLQESEMRSPLLLGASFGLTPRINWVTIGSPAMNPKSHVRTFVAACGAGLLGGSFLGAPLEALAIMPHVVRGPYLQMGTSTGMLVRWRTDTPALGCVRYGTNSASLDLTADGTNATDHVVALSDLLPDTFYYYSIGTPDLTLAGGTNYFFRTAPPPGSRRPFRIWALGDSGYTNRSAIPVRDAYYNFKGGRYTDLWLMLGDNAYHGGGDSVWQVSVFITYSNLLCQTPMWSTIGNQETFNQPTVSDTAPYFQNLSLPTAGEAGGVPSGTEKYYSFDYGNVHFVCLDSMTSVRTEGGPMLVWLEADLMQNTNDWLIAFWHHPPYSKGSNDSDVRTEQIEMRANATRILESYGVDLVLSGHSHSYERSYLINGHYGLSSTFSSSTMLVDGGDGRVDGSGAYTKPTLGPGTNEGAVYAVAGGGSSLGGGALNHPVMFRSINGLGSMVLDVQANRLDGTFLRETGAIDDRFTLIKGSQPLRVTASAVSNGNVALEWNAVARRTYQVEFKPDLIGGEWSDVSGPIQAEGMSASWSGPADAGSARGFYHVKSHED